MPQVSVIVPNFNHKAYLEERLATIFNQTYQDFEVILLDDASTDGSTDILKKYQNHPKVSHLVINETNSGSPFEQWKKGLALAQGTWIWMAESDDSCAPQLLELLLSQVTNAVGIAYVQSHDINEQGTFIEDRLHYTQDFQPNIWEKDFEMAGMDFIQSYLSVKNVIPNASAVLFKKELVQPELFSPALLHMRMCGDWWFWIQLCEQTKIAFVAQPYNYFRHHQGVSRLHATLQQRRNRLIEEGLLRAYLKRKLRIIQPKVNQKMLKKWYQSYPWMGIFQPQFYRLKGITSSPFSLFLNFLLYKIKNSSF